MPFNEAWLREHQAKMAGIHAPAKLGPESYSTISLRLRRPTLLLNETIRMHWATRRKYQASLASEIAAGAPALSEPPMAKALVTIVRYSVGMPDRDGLVGGMKQLIDVLLVRSDKHPNGLGFIVDDDPEHMELVVRAERVGKRSEQRTEITIERLG